MEFVMNQLPSAWYHLLTSPSLFSYPSLPENYVHWTQTPESHVYTVDLPGVRKEEIKVEIEDSTYPVIRTEAMDESTMPAKSFKRKFRLPEQIDIDGIRAAHQDGVLTITVPRFRRRAFFIDPEDIPDTLHVLARAA